MELICRASAPLLGAVPLTLKTRTGWEDGAEARSAHLLAPQLASWGVTALTLHGRTRAQRYSRTADWGYVRRVSDALGESAPPPAAASSEAGNAAFSLIGNGDVMDWTQFAEHREQHGVHTCMLARGALVKPWLCTEIQERRRWDISASERLDLLRTFASHGLEHWGSDGRGVETTRRFLLEWLSFLHRYIPVGLLERDAQTVPQGLNWRAPAYRGRNALESLMGSADPEDWVRLSRMVLGPTPPGFRFSPKHKAKSGGAEGGLYDGGDVQG